jgi:hypothetical protein
MTKLEEMWAALAAYQPQADAAGHGKSWARMCSERTYAAAFYAADSAAAADAAVAAFYAADAAVAANGAFYAAYWAQKAIDRIKEITTPPAAQHTEPVCCVADIDRLQRQMFLDLGYSLSDPLYATPPAQPKQERNFCARCGKRTADLTVIHTCTPPQDKNT